VQISAQRLSFLTKALEVSFSPSRKMLRKHIKRILSVTGLPTTTVKISPAIRVPQLPLRNSLNVDHTPL
jgi:hypothetical protein